MTEADFDAIDLTIRMPPNIDEYQSAVEDF